MDVFTLYRGIFKDCLVIDESGKPCVDPEKVLVFRGRLDPPQECSVWRVEDTIHFKWSYKTNRSKESYKVNFLVYDIDHEFRFKVVEEDVRRGEYSMVCSLLAYKKGPLHVYIGVVDAYTEELSDSVYVVTLSSYKMLARSKNNIRYSRRLR